MLKWGDKLEMAKEGIDALFKCQKKCLRTISVFRSCGLIDNMIILENMILYLHQ